MITKKEEERGRVVGEARKITFRDDNFNIDSKSRFSDIVESIPLSAQELIKALEDAIRAEAMKDDSEKSFEDRKVDQEAVELKKTESYVSKIETKNAGQALTDAITEISQFLKDNKGNKEKLTPIVLKLKEFGYAKITEIETMEQAQEVIALFS
jgi:hypothetical protein